MRRLPRLLMAISVRFARWLLLVLMSWSALASADVGVYYFPGWDSKSSYWKDLKGMRDSRSPGVPWPDREPVLGFYPEEKLEVAEQHIEWAKRYGITFFAYDWYWSGRTTHLNHAIDNFLKASNNDKMRFALLWANHSDIPRSLQEFDDMVAFWLDHYLRSPLYYRVSDRPVVFIFANDRLDANARLFGSSARALLLRANEAARSAGLAGLFFVAATNAEPSDALEKRLSSQGFSAYSGWNYAVARDKRRIADYQSMVDTYLDYFEKAMSTKGGLAFVPSVSPGWDSRPWHGNSAVVRANATPQKFKQMLLGAKALTGSNKKGILDLVMIEAWNEFGEGAYIEPTKKWGFQYLETIHDVFGDAR